MNKKERGRWETKGKYFAVMGLLGLLVLCLVAPSSVAANTPPGSYVQTYALSKTSGQVSDEMLLRVIDAWKHGKVSDSTLLEIIDFWKGTTPNPYVSQLTGYYLAADLYLDGNVCYWDVWLRADGYLPGLSSNIAHLDTIPLTSGFCNLFGFLTSIDVGKLVVDATVSLLQNIIAEACWASCAYCSLVTGGVCAIACGPACVIVQFAPIGN
jgi:hypothetical protein